MHKWLLYFLSLFSLSMAANLVRWAAAPPDVIGFWRLLGAALCLAPFAYRERLHFIKMVSDRRGLFLIFSTSIFFFAHLWTYFYAAQNTSIAHCMILFATNPLFIALGAYLWFREPFTAKHWISYILALLGLFFLIRQNLGADWQIFNISRGDISALISAILFSGYILSGKKARERSSNISFSFLLYSLVGVLFFISGVLKGMVWFDYGANTWTAIAGTVLFPTLLGHALFSYLYPKLNINLMACGKLIEPLLSSLGAYFFFAEKVNNNTLIAFGFTACAVVILLWRPEKPPQTTHL